MTLITLKPKSTQPPPRKVETHSTGCGWLSRVRFVSQTHVPHDSRCCWKQISRLTRAAAHAKFVQSAPDLPLRWWRFPILFLTSSPLHLSLDLFQRNPLVTAAALLGWLWYFAVFFFSFFSLPVMRESSVFTSRDFIHCCCCSP